ncbi:MAG: hypothetical protein ACRC30_02710, partial [Clostridium sp.]
MRDNYIVLGENSIEINLKDTVLFNDIKEVSYTNLTTETSPNTKIKIDLHLINDTSKSITFRDEYEASNLYKKLQALSN